MSSSDDSDICDFTSNLETLLSKRTKKFKKEIARKMNRSPEQIVSDPMNGIQASENSVEDESSKLVDPVINAVKESSTSINCLENNITGSLIAKRTNDFLELMDDSSDDILFTAADAAGEMGSSIMGQRRSKRNCVLKKRTSVPLPISLENDTNGTPTIQQESSDVYTRTADKLNRLQEIVDGILNEGTRSGRGRRRGRGAQKTRGAARGRARTRGMMNFLTTGTITEANSTPDRLARNVPEVRDTITIEDDEEKEKPLEMNPLVMITVDWLSVERNTFKVRKFQCLEVIFDFYLKKSEKDPKLLFFTLDDKEIDLRKSSYVSLRLKENDGKVLEGGILPDKFLDREEKKLERLREPDSVELKVQLADARRNKHFKVYLRSGDSMEYVIWQVMDELDEDFDSVKLYFDGALVKPTDTLESLDMEEGDCFDAVIAS